jgi:ketosteroid isomerase-like protein
MPVRQADCEVPTMTDESMTGGIAARVRAALESADDRAFGDLLDPDVRWGAPGDPAPSCQNRGQVLDWYRRGRQAGVRARVTEMAVCGDKILVGLKVTGNRAAEQQDGEADRWQVLTVGGGRIVDIRGFEDRSEAAAHTGAAI